MSVKQSIDGVGASNKRCAVTACLLGEISLNTRGLASAMPVVLDKAAAKTSTAALSSDEIVNTVTQILLTDEEFANELERWCEDRCDRFFLDDESEHLMEHWKLHEDFCNLP